MFFVALVFGVLALIFLLLKKEYIYSLILLLMFLVAIPFSFEYNLIRNEPVETILWIDNSQSMKSKLKDIEELLSIIEPDSVRFFGSPFNDPKKDFASLDTNKLNIIVSDFLFDIPESIISENTVFVPVSSGVKTNHLIKRVYFTNISQVDYLGIELLSKSSIKVYGNGKLLYNSREISTNCLIPTIILPKEIIVQSLNTNILIKTKQYSDIGVLWFELNPDFAKLNQVIRDYSLRCEYFVKITKYTNFYFGKKFESLLVGYPSGDTRIEDLVDLVKEGGRIVIVSPDESFLRKIFRVSSIQNAKLSTSSFLYSSNYEIFEVVKGYEGVVDGAFKYHYPIVELSNIEILDREGYSVCFWYKGVEFLIFMVRNISRIDKQLAKEGVVYSISEDVYGNLLKFLLKGKKQSAKEIFLLESAFDGGITPKGKVVYLSEFNDWFSTNSRPKVPVIISKEENISQWWLLMIIIILVLTAKWVFRE